MDCFFQGIRTDQGVKVTYHNPKVAINLPLYLGVANHSPTGFEWGYGGSGPTQLSLALLVTTLLASHGCPYLRAATESIRPTEAPFALGTLRRDAKLTPEQKKQMRAITQDIGQPDSDLAPGWQQIKALLANCSISNPNLPELLQSGFVDTEQLTDFLYPKGKGKKHGTRCMFLDFRRHVEGMSQDNRQSTHYMAGNAQWQLSTLGVYKWILAYQHTDNPPPVAISTPIGVASGI